MWLCIRLLGPKRHDPLDHATNKCEGRSPVRPNTGEPDPKKTIGDRQPQPVFLLPALEDEKLMAQGKGF